MKNYSNILIFILFTLTRAGGFEELTLIKTPVGYKPIAQLKVFDDVVGWSHNTVVLNHLTHTSRYEVQQMYDMTFQRKGDTVRLICAVDQLFRSNNQWIAAHDLEKNDEVLTLDGPATLVKKEYKKINQTLIRLSVSPVFSYCVTSLDIIVHNELMAFSLVYVIGQGFVWPTLAGVVSAVGCYAFKFLAKRIYASNFQNHTHLMQESNNGSSSEYSGSSGGSDGGPPPPNNNDKDDSSSDQQQEDDQSNEGANQAGVGYVIAKTVSETWKEAKKRSEELKEGIKKVIKHPHGVYNHKSYHKAQNSGRKSRAPKNPQDLLDKSVEVINQNRKLTHRVAWEDDHTIAVFKVERPREFHGHIETWHGADKSIRDTLKLNGLATSTGKRIINE